MRGIRGAEGEVGMYEVREELGHAREMETKRERTEVGEGW